MVAIMNALVSRRAAVVAACLLLGVAWAGFDFSPAQGCCDGAMGGAGNESHHGSSGGGSSGDDDALINTLRQGAAQGANPWNKPGGSSAIDGDGGYATVPQGGGSTDGQDPATTSGQIGQVGGLIQQQQQDSSGGGGSKVGLAVPGLVSPQMAPPTAGSVGSSPASTSTTQPVTPLPPEKQALLDAVLDHVNTSRTGQGASSSFINMADPNRVRDVITNNVDSITIDPTAPRPTTAGNWTDRNSSITLNQPPTANPQAAMHELIHSGDFARGGDGIRDARDADAGKPGPDGDATNLVPGGFEATLNQAKTLDSRLEALIPRIQSGTATPDEVNRFRQSLDNWSNRAQAVRNDAGMQRALDALGGRYDPPGYVNEVNRRIDAALKNQPVR
jgi:hypothetical protein